MDLLLEIKSKDKKNKDKLKLFFDKFDYFYYLFYILCLNRRDLEEIIMIIFTSFFLFWKIIMFTIKM